MITLTSSGYIVARGSHIYLSYMEPVVSGIVFNSDSIPLANTQVLQYHIRVPELERRKITPPLLMQLIANTTENILIKFKEKSYIIGKNLIFTYDEKTTRITPMMLHVVKGTRTIREGKIVINPELFDVDVTFYKMFQTILATGVDVELTRFIEDKYYLSLDLPKFGGVADKKKHIEDVKVKLLASIKS